MSKSVNQSRTAPEEPGLIAQWRQNRTGFAGLLFSGVQLLMHGLWIGLTEALARSAENISMSSWQAWLIVGGLLLSGVATMLAMFLSLQGSIHGEPKTPALIGLAVSFFTGALVTFVLLLTAMASGAPQ